MYRGRTSGLGAGYPGADVQNRAGFMLQEPDVWLGARMSSPMNPDLVWGGYFRIWGGN